MSQLKKSFYFTSPMEVVKVTSANMEEVAKWCGGRVATSANKKNPEKLDTYVWVPTPKGTTISWAYAGMYITRRVVVTLSGDLKVTWSVFRRDYFEKNYFAEPIEAVEATWGRLEAGPKKKVAPAATVQAMKKMVTPGVIAQNKRDEEVFDRDKAGLSPAEADYAQEIKSDMEAQLRLEQAKADGHINGEGGPMETDVANPDATTDIQLAEGLSMSVGKSADEKISETPHTDDLKAAAETVQQMDGATLGTAPKTS